MPHDRAYLRAKSWSKAIRKREIDRATAPYSWHQDYYDNLHQYSKNKIHCSCWMCSIKTNNKGKHRTKPGNYFPSKNWKPADRRKLDSTAAQIEEIEGEEEND